MDLSRFTLRLCYTASIDMLFRHFWFHISFTFRISNKAIYYLNGKDDQLITICTTL